MAKKLSRAEKIRRYITAHPNMPLSEIAAKFDTTYQIVYMTKKTMPKKITLTATEAMLANKIGVSTTEYAKQKAKILKGEKLPKLKPTKEYSYAWVDTNQLDDSTKDALASQLLDTVNPECITMEEPASDPVNHPAHYKTGGIETIDFIEAKELNYNMGNAVKYISRAEHKGNKKQDLEKAVWYLNREIGKL